MASSAASQAQGQALIDVELYTICSNLPKKFEEIKSGKKTALADDLKDAVRLLLYGAKPDTLHTSFKENIFNFLVHVASFSDVLATQNGVSMRSRILITLLLRLLYASPKETSFLFDVKLKRSFNLMFNVFQRMVVVSSSSSSDSVINSTKRLEKNEALTSATCQALDMQTGVPRQAILLLPTILLMNGGKTLKIEQAGEITKNLCQWLLVYTSPNQSSSGKKTLFQSKNVLSPVRMFLIILNITWCPV